MKPEQLRDRNKKPSEGGILQDTGEGDAVRDGIPANGTRPTEPQGPEDMTGGATPPVG